MHCSLTFRLQFSPCLSQSSTVKTCSQSEHRNLTLFSCLTRIRETLPISAVCERQCGQQLRLSRHCAKHNLQKSRSHSKHETGFWTTFLQIRHSKSSSTGVRACSLSMLACWWDWPSMLVRCMLITSRELFLSSFREWSMKA